jgi:hypothetical protein
LLFIHGFAASFSHRPIANLRLRGVNLIHHDDPYPQYRFGLLPEPLTALPFGDWKMNLPMAARPEAFPF